MDWINRMNNAVNFIESNLLEKIDSKMIAKEADTTAFHFQRMFHMLSGFTLGEYIRRRRLTLAAQEIASSDINIIDVALKYGYESHSSFTKAFTKLHGFAPVIARESGVKIKAYPPISFHLSIKGDSNMDYKIKEVKQLRLVGKIIKISTEGEEHWKTVPALWDKCRENGTIDEIRKLADLSGYFKGKMLSAIMKYSENEESFDYMIGVESKIKSVPDGMEEKIINPQSYAVFEDTGPLLETMHKLHKRIYSEWVPATKYIYAESPEFELAYPISPDDNTQHHCEVWKPVVLGK